MKILVLNCGSSSVKYQFIETDTREVLTKGIVERIGMDGALLTNKRSDGDEIKITGDILDHTMAIEYILAVLLSGQHGVIRDKAEIDAIGHRVVHGGETFTQSVLITPDVLKGIQDNIELAPLHNPHNLRGIQACMVHLPITPQVGVFDTAFHQQMPSKAYVYGIPYSLYREYKIRRYGFHGTSHRYVSQRFAQIQGPSSLSWKLVTCHLGNGCSLCAIDGGRSVDTSMGFTPDEGLIMGTRSGDVDPGAVLYLMRRHKCTPEELTDILNKQSGLYGISGTSNDMRDLLQKREAGDNRARLAVEMFCYSAQKYLGAYLGALDGVHAIIFAGGIGENAFQVRAEICQGLRSLGILLDPERNRATLGVEGEISAAESRTKVWVIPTNEELLIARDTARCILGIPLA